VRWGRLGASHGSRRLVLSALSVLTGALGLLIGRVASRRALAGLLERQVAVALSRAGAGDRLLTLALSRPRPRRGLLGSEAGLARRRLGRGLRRDGRVSPCPRVLHGTLKPPALRRHQHERAPPRLARRPLPATRTPPVPDTRTAAATISRVTRRRATARAARG
jgi:hypothetical protein